MRKPALNLALLSVASLVLGLVLMSCAPDKSAPTLVARATAVATEAAAVPAEAEPLLVVAQAGTPVATVEPFTDVECLECHTDQDRLMELAVEEEDKAAALSSGPG